MAAGFLVVTIIFYFAYLIDWKDFLGVAGEGGWASLVIYCVVAAFIYAALITPHAVSSGVMHH